MFWKREINAQGRGKLYKSDKISDNPAGKRLRDLEAEEKFIDLLFSTLLALCGSDAKS